MAQNYNELRKNNVRDAIYEDVANNLEVLRTSWSGNAFPENPKVGQACYRVDEDNLYYWDGFEWSQKGGGGAAKMKVMELPASGTERYSVELEGGRCLDKNVMFVFVDKVAQEPSTYSLSDGGTVLNFSPAVPAGSTLTVRWFNSDIGMSDTSFIATDEEMSEGTAQNKVPNVKQVKSEVSKVPVGVKTYSSSLVYNSGEFVISSGENVAMYKSLVDGNTGHALTETDYWEEISLGGGSGTGHHVGEIFYTSRLDTELNGAVEANGGVYAVAGFTGEQSVPALLAEGKLPFVSMSEYESIVSANGSCRAFGWDGADATVFKVPKLNDVYLMAGTAASAGEFISESLPNITGSLYNASTTYQDIGLDNGVGSGAIEIVTDSRLRRASENITGYDNNFLGWDFNASRSSSTYQDGAKVRPDSVRYRAMVQLATGVKEDASKLEEYQFNNPHFFGQSMWSDIAPNNTSWLASNGQWNAKSVYPDYYDWLVGQMNAGVSGFVASTATYTDYDFVINTADQTFRLPLLDGSEDLPSDRYDTLTLGESGTLYTAPANGFYRFSIGLPASGYFAIFKGNNVNVAELITNEVAGIAQNYVATADVKNGQTIRIQYNNAPTLNAARFYYAQGNGSLYFYVGDTVQDASLINAGAVLSDLATKTNSVQAAAASMPSNRYIDLTLGASGSTYTAPANGWFFARHTATGSNGQTYIYNNNNGAASSSISVDATWTDHPVSPIAVKKGDVVAVTYVRSTINLLRFVYAEGEN